MLVAFFNRGKSVIGACTLIWSLKCNFRQITDSSNSEAGRQARRAALLGHGNGAREEGGGGATWGEGCELSLPSSEPLDESCATTSHDPQNPSFDYFLCLYPLPILLLKSTWCPPLPFSNSQFTPRAHFTFPKAEGRGSPFPV